MYQQAAILCGGLGTRLYPITKSIPKTMVPVHGKPFLYWQIKYLQAQGVRRVVLLVSHLSEVVKEYFRLHPFPDLEILYSDEPMPMGTGGALFAARPLLDQKFFLLNGDSFLPLPLDRLATHHDQSGNQITIVALSELNLVPVAPNLRVSDLLVLEYSRNQSPATGFTWIDAGVYLFDRSIISTSQPTEPFPIEDYWRPLLSKKAVGVFPCQQRFYDIGTPERLKFFEQELPQFFPGLM